MKKISLLLGVAFLVFTAFVLPDSQQTEFEAFLAEIDEIAFPYQIQIEDLTRHYEEMERLSDEAFDQRFQQVQVYRNFIPEAKARFSRMGPPLIEPLAKYQVSDEVVAVIYHTFQFNRFYGRNAYRLMLYDQKGNPLDHQEALAGKQKKKRKFALLEKPQVQSFVLAYYGVEQTQTATIDAGGKISIQTFENVWEKDLDEYGAMENSVTAYTAVAQQEMQLTAEGKIKEISLGIDKTARASIK